MHARMCVLPVVHHRLTHTHNRLLQRSLRWHALTARCSCRYKSGVFAQYNEDTTPNHEISGGWHYTMQAALLCRGNVV